MRETEWRGDFPCPDLSSGVVTQPHTDQIFRPESFRRLVDGVTVRLREIYAMTPFDCLVGIGFSGVPLVSVLSHQLGVPMALVRKPEVSRACDAAHVTGYIDCRRYLIVDDLVASGWTVQWVVTSLAGVSDAEPVGVLTYNQADHRRPLKIELGTRTVLVPVLGMTQELPACPS